MYIKGTDVSLLRVDSSVPRPRMLHDPNYLGSLILNCITPKERMHGLIIHVHVLKNLL